MKHLCLKRICAMLAILGITNLAFGQYAWVDEKGVKQYSDVPPPSSISSNQIIKSPKKYANTQQPAANEQNVGLDQSSSSQKAPTINEKNADFLKRKSEQAEKTKKATEEEQVKVAKAKNCQQTRDYQHTLESGERIARLDKNGERSFLSDDQRQNELRDAKRNLENCK